MKLSGVLICMPVLGRANCVETTESLFSLGQALLANKIPSQFSWFGAADAEEVRNLFLSVWYDGHPNCSHLLMVDADMHFHPNMIRDMLGFDKPVVGCYYAKRHFPLEAVGKSLQSDDYLSDVKNGHLKVAAVGGGILLIRRDAIKTMIEKMPEIVVTNEKSVASHPGAESLKSFGVKRIIRAFDKLNVNDVRLSEDMAFCHRWRECGGEVWANVEHPVGHVGPLVFPLRYMDYLEKKAKEAA